MDMDKIKETREVAIMLSKFAFNNGILIVGDSSNREDFLTNDVLNATVTRGGRTDEEIEALMRQFKVMFITFSPMDNITIRYKVVD